MKEQKDLQFIDITATLIEKHGNKRDRIDFLSKPLIAGTAQADAVSQRIAINSTLREMALEHTGKTKTLNNDILVYTISEGDYNQWLIALSEYVIPAMAKKNIIGA